MQVIQKPGKPKVIKATQADLRKLRDAAELMDFYGLNLGDDGDGNAAMNVAKCLRDVADSLEKPAASPTTSA